METIDNKYVKDQPDPAVDTHGLDELFNVAIENNQIIDTDTGEVIDTVKGMRMELAEVADGPDIDQIILDNIDRANRFLDKIENDITGERGTYTASLMEAVGKLIDTVTSAANSVTGISHNAEVLRQKERDLDIKEKKLMLGSIVKGAENVNITNNQLVMNREELMQMIKEGQG